MKVYKQEIQQLFLNLVRLGIGTGSVSGFKSQELGSIDWEALEELANEQGLSAVVVDGIEKLPDSLRPPKLVLLQWIGETLQGYEYRFEQYCKAIAEMAAFYNQHGFKMMVLKGYACALDWPKPEHRPCGDIDIWLFGRQEDADKVLASWFKAQGLSNEIDSTHHYHHTVFNWKDFMVENHSSFISTHLHASYEELEKTLEKLGRDDSHYMDVSGEKVYQPSPNLHALFLIIHALNHFASIGISLRHVLDWAFYVKAHTKEIDWEWLNKVVDEYHMRDFVGCLNAICVENLGFDAIAFNNVQFNPTLKDRILQEIFNPEYDNNLPSNLFSRVAYKYRRWKSNEWKRKLCFNESNRESLWKGVKGHILKPKSI